MEKVLSTDERIRRAEEIYQKRRVQNYNIKQARVGVNSSRKEYKLLKKMLIQIAICSLIYILFYAIKNEEYIFSEDFLKHTKEALSYDISIEETYKNFVAWLSNTEEKNDEKLLETSNKTDEKNKKETETEVNLTEKIEDIADAAMQTEETLAVTEDASNTNDDEKSDAEIIKANYSIIKPLTGTITSRFGTRTPTTPTVPVYHTGIDIAADTGTIFVAAMSGTVTQVSDEGDYGNHIKISQDDVTTLYAHCSKIYVNEGDNILQGQEIGEVGETGNATGPHLHFEIRKSERYVNPDDILDF